MGDDGVLSPGWEVESLQPAQQQQSTQGRRERCLSAVSSTNVVGMNELNSSPRARKLSSVSLRSRRKSLRRGEEIPPPLPLPTSPALPPTPLQVAQMQREREWEQGLERMSTIKASSQPQTVLASHTHTRPRAQTQRQVGPRPSISVDSLAPRYNTPITALPTVPSGFNSTNPRLSSVNANAGITPLHTRSRSKTVACPGAYNSSAYPATAPASAVSTRAPSPVTEVEVTHVEGLVLPVRNSVVTSGEDGFEDDDDENYEDLFYNPSRRLAGNSPYGQYAAPSSSTGLISRRPTLVQARSCAALSTMTPVSSTVYESRKNSAELDNNDSNDDTLQNASGEPCQSRWSSCSSFASLNSMNTKKSRRSSKSSKAASTYGNPSSPSATASRKASSSKLRIDAHATTQRAAQKVKSVSASVGLSLNRLDAALGKLIGRANTVVRRNQHQHTNSLSSNGNVYPIPSQVLSSRASKRHLVVRGVVLGDSRAVEGVRGWCEHVVGSVRRVEQVLEGDGDVCVWFVREGDVGKVSSCSLSLFFLFCVFFFVFFFL